MTQSTSPAHFPPLTFISPTYLDNRQNLDWPQPGATEHHHPLASHLQPDVPPPLAPTVRPPGGCINSSIGFLFPVIVLLLSFLANSQYFSNRVFIGFSIFDHLIGIMVRKWQNLHNTLLPPLTHRMQRIPRGGNVDQDTMRAIYVWGAFYESLHQLPRMSLQVHNRTTAASSVSKSIIRAFFWLDTIKRASKIVLPA